MPSLAKIYQSNAEYVRNSGYTVTVDTRLGTVAIEDEAGEGFFFRVVRDTHGLMKPGTYGRKPNIYA